MTLFSLLLTGCSQGHGSKHGPGPGIPEPGAGKVAAFELHDLSSKYDLDKGVGDSLGGHVTSDRSGNVYAVNGDADPLQVLRMTPKGAVSRTATLDGLKRVYGMTVLPTGEVVLGSAGQLYKLDSHGKVSPVRSSHVFQHPNPIGVRPDGSVIVADADGIWSVKDAEAVHLYAEHGSSSDAAGAVDASGTAYVKSSSKGFAELLVLSPGKKAEKVKVSGELPDSNGSVSGLSPVSFAGAGSGGVYAVATSHRDHAAYVVHVQGTKGTVMAKAAFGKQRTCRTGKQYPALDNPCSMPWFVVQSGNRVLTMGRASAELPPLPALALQADKK
ncbi:hypothetical protein [Streptomyces sp. NBC_00859]|uniref:hypothetical protein n=1 Tax=Streptomyces sp. NBC_00859 TaxID=2903682 RepID=UPI003865CD61|nr:hypothetical protein OG584_13895 [Streptomyces sp. NBC_00859]